MFSKSQLVNGIYNIILCIPEADIYHWQPTESNTHTVIDIAKISDINLCLKNNYNNTVTIETKYKFTLKHV